MLQQESELDVLRARHASLTSRERQVLALVVSGLLNKQVAGELGISETTVKAHRGQVMRKMCADSIADLVTMATRLRLRAGVDNGYFCVTQFDGDRLLDPIRSDARFRETIVVALQRHERAAAVFSEESGPRLLGVR